MTNAGESTRRQGGAEPDWGGQSERAGSRNWRGWQSVVRLGEASGLQLVKTKAERFAAGSLSRVKLAGEQMGPLMTPCRPTQVVPNASVPFSSLSGKHHISSGNEILSNVPRASRHEVSSFFRTVPDGVPCYCSGGVRHHSNHAFVLGPWGLGSACW